MPQNSLQSALDLAQKIDAIEADIDRGFACKAASDRSRLDRDIALITSLEIEIRDLAQAIKAISGAVERDRSTLYPDVDDRPPNQGLLAGADRLEAEVLLESLTVSLYRAKALLASKRDQLREERKAIEDRQCRRGDHARVISYADGRQALTLTESHAISNARSRGNWAAIAQVQALCTRPIVGPSEGLLDRWHVAQEAQEALIEERQAQKVSCHSYRRSRGGRKHTNKVSARNNRLLRLL
jgi:hypothetical protein